MDGGGLMSIFGQAFSMFGQIDSYHAQAKEYKTQAIQAQQNAAMALETAKASADMYAVQARKMISSTTSEYAAGGLEGGSVMAVIADSKANAELDRLNILFGGDIKSKEFTLQAAAKRRAEDSATKGAMYAALGGGFTTANAAAGMK